MPYLQLLYKHDDFGHLLSDLLACCLHWRSFTTSAISTVHNTSLYMIYAFSAKISNAYSKVTIKLSLCLIKHHSMKAYGGVET
jgi:hypothetical protein